MKKSICFIILISTLNCFSQTPELSWANGFGGTNDETSPCMTIDPAGNVYLAGAFSNTVDFNAGTGVYTLTATSPPAGKDIYITKYSAAGNFIWAKAMGSYSTEEVLSITTDGSANIYVTGYFYGTIDFDPGVGVANVSAISSGYDLFVAKYDSSGMYQWVKSIGGNGNGIGRGITLDGNSNIYITGEFENTFDFDPSLSVFNLTAAGQSDIFVCKLDNSGNFIWAKAMGGASVDVARAIALDNNGNVFTTGQYLGSADFDPGIGTYSITSSNSTPDIFISKLNSSGNFVWANGINGSTGPDKGNAIGTDGSGNVYLTGLFTGTADFDPGTGSYTLSAGTSNYDAFTLKLNNSGNFQWAFNIGSSGTAEQGSGIKVSNNGDVYTTGLLSGIGDFDPGTSSYTLATTGNGDVYVHKINSAGGFIWARVFGSSASLGADQGYAITLDNVDNVFVTGTFNLTADFDPGPGTYSATSNGMDDAFIVKFCQTTPPVISSIGQLTVCPGSSVTLVSTSATSYSWSNGAFTPSISIGIGGVYSVTVTDINGCKSISNPLTVTLATAPIVSINNGSICPYQSYTLTPTGANTYTFINGGPVISPSITSIYSVSGTAANSCTSISTGTVVVYPTPTITAISNTLCQGNTYTILPVGANTYSISGNSFIISPTTTTSYSITGTSAQGCPALSLAVISITVLQLPLPTITVSSGTICLGENYTFQVNGASTYSYSSGSSIVAPAYTTTYSVAGISSAGCISIPVTSTVNVNSLPTITIVPDRSFVCANEALSLTAFGANSYTWNNTSQMQNITITAIPNTTYSVTGTGINGCRSITSISLSVNECTDANEMKLDETINIFPVPFNDNIYMEVPVACKLLIFNSIGRLIYQNNLNSGLNKYSNEQLPFGLYYFVFDNGGEIMTVKIPKN